MQNTKSPSRIKADKEKTRAMMLGTVIAVIAGFIIIVSILTKHNRVGIDPISLCPKDFQPNGYYSILLDTTDPYNIIQREYLNKFFKDLINRIPVHSKISVFAIGESINESIYPRISICNPGSGKNASSWNANPRKKQKRWKDHFFKPLDKTFNEIIKMPKAQHSPIMEMIQAVSIKSFPFGDTSIPKELIIVSDLIQHTKEYSHYKGAMKLTFDDFKSVPYYNKVRTDLSGVDITLLYLRRDDSTKIQGKNHALFWADHLESLGGNVKKIKRVDG